MKEGPYLVLQCGSHIYRVGFRHTVTKSRYNYSNPIFIRFQALGLPLVCVTLNSLPVNNMNKARMKELISLIDEYSTVKSRVVSSLLLGFRILDIHKEDKVADCSGKCWGNQEGLG